MADLRSRVKPARLFSRPNPTRKQCWLEPPRLRAVVLSAPRIRKSRGNCDGGALGWCALLR
eukprot:6858786-Pyramimonas_sp.AAC.1